MPKPCWRLHTDGSFAGVALPDTFEEPLLTMGSGVSAQDITGDTRPETMLSLREIGFPVEDVRFARDEEGREKAFFTLRLPDAPNAGGTLVEWTLMYQAGRWRVAPLPVPEWPLVGGSSLWWWN